MLALPCTLPDKSPMIGRLGIECLVGLLQKGGTIILSVSDSNFAIFHQSLT